jgi:thiol-disulfide isomerase/thioredoxin
MILPLLGAIAIVSAATPPTAPPAPAPEWSGTWIQGEAPPADAVVLVAFWAPWNGPSLAEIPRLARLHRDHAERGLAVIGLVARDSRDPDQAATIRDAVATRGERMPYRILLDDGATAQRVRAAGRPLVDEVRPGLEHPALVAVFDRKGACVYCGAPHLLDAVVPAIVSGDWDAARDGAALAKREEEFRAIQLGGAAPEETLRNLDAFLARHPEHAPHVALRRVAILANLGRTEAAEALARELLDRYRCERDYAQLLILANHLRGPEDAPPATTRTLILEAAALGVEISGGTELEPLLQRAELEFAFGSRDQAIALARRGLELAPTQASRDFIRTMLIGFGVRDEPVR